MRRIDKTSQFKKDFKREFKGRHGPELDSLLLGAMKLLAVDAALPVAMKDHQLIGTLKEFRDCHLKPDLVLVYRKKPGILILSRLGSHAELFRK